MPQACYTNTPFLGGNDTAGWATHRAAWWYPIQKGHRKLDGCLAPGVWRLVLAPGAWCLVPGACCLAPGAWCWCLVPGTRRLLPGVWCLVPGTCLVPAPIELHN